MPTVARRREASRDVVQIAHVESAAHSLALCRLATAAVRAGHQHDLADSLSPVEASTSSNVFGAAVRVVVIGIYDWEKSSRLS